LARQRVPALVRVKYAEDFALGAEGLVGDYGLGRIEPNTVMMGESEDPDHIEAYCRLLRTIFTQRKNAIVVRDSRHVADEGLPDREQRRIDVWLATRSNKNATLMLLFAYMLQSSPEWRGARLVIKSLAPNEEARRGVQDSLAEFLASSRIDAEIETYVMRPPRAPIEEIARYSADADLVFMGLRPPESEESTAEYAEYYREILRATRAFPLTIITLAGETIEFSEVFA
jgi:nucleotide-binding universal stress UspA family protein